MNEEKDLLDGVIEELVGNLNTLEDGSKEKSSAIDDIAKLYKLRIDNVKVMIDEDDKYNRRVSEDNNFLKEIEFKEQQLAQELELREKEMELKQKEMELKQKELDELKNDRYFKTGLAVFELVVTIVAYNAWTNRGFRFEENGTIRSNTFKNIFMRAKKLKMK